MNSVINELNVKPFWDAGIRGRGVVVAVLGSGYEVTHPEFDGRIAGTYWARLEYSGDKTQVQETDGHETSVASIIAGNTVGIAPDAKLLLIKTNFNNDSTFGNANLPGMVAHGINYAIDWRGANGERVNIINLSIGNGTRNLQIHEAIKRAVANNIIVIASAGNMGDGNPETDEYSYPAARPEVVSVGAYTHNFKVASYSNSNDGIDLISAGVNVDAAIGKDGYRKFAGTSSAAPCVSAVAALLRQKLTREMGRYPTAVELKTELMKHTTLTGITGSTDSRLIGRGRLHLTYEEKDKPRDEDIDINVAIDGLCAAGIFDSPQYWKGIMAYIDGLTPDHAEYYRFRYVQLAFKKFYNYIS